MSGIQKMMLCALVLLIFGVFATVILVLSPTTYKSNAAWDISACRPGPAQGNPGTLIPGTNGNSIAEGSSDPVWYLGNLYNSKDLSDPFFTEGKANIEARWAGSNEYRPAFCHDRGCGGTREDKPAYPQVIGGWLYDPAYDWGRFQNGVYPNNDLVWDRTMEYTTGQLKIVAAQTNTDDNWEVYTKVSRNCVLSKVIENMIREGYPVENVFSHQPFGPVSAGQSTIIIHAAGKKGNSHPTMTLTINNRFIQQWKNVQNDPDTRNFGQYSVTVPYKIDPSQVVVSMDSGDCSDDNPGQCQALYIDKVTIDDLDYETEAPTTFNSAQWDNSHGCTPAFGNPYPGTEALGCKGYVRYAGTDGGGGGGGGGTQPTTAPQAPVITVAPTYTPVPTLTSPVTPVTAAKSMIIAAGFIGLITMGFIVFGL